MTRWAAAAFGRRPFHREATLAAALGIAFLSSGVTSLLGFSAVFGAFAAGVAFGGDGRVRDHLSRSLRPVVLGLFLPVFFTYTGLRTDAGSLAGATAWLLCLALTGAAIVGKVGGCALAARSLGLPATEAMALGLLMNTRGLMELVAAGIGLDLGLIPPSVYFMLVFMAVTTTFMTTPLVRRFVPQLGAGMARNSDLTGTR